MNTVFTRDLNATYPLAVKASGMYFYDEGGRAYLDMSGGAAVSCLGHQHPAVISAVQTQLADMAFAHTAFFTNKPQQRLAQMLAERFPEAGARVYFLSGGSEANETALKMAWQYWRARGKPEKMQIVSRQHSYHGNTLGALSVSGNLARRQPVAGVLHDWPRIEPAYAYRYQRPGESEADYGQRAANQLEQAILSAGPENVAAFIAEPVVGASLGAVAAPEGYFKRVREICDEYGVLLIADEIMCGTGRTGTFFAHQQEDIVPDIVTLAKGIGGGYMPLAAAVVRRKIVESFAQGSGFDHGHTYVGHASACAAGCAVINTIEKEGLLSRVQSKGDRLMQELTRAFGFRRYVGEIRTRGLFAGIELVADRERKTPIPESVKVAGQLKKTAMKNGLVCYPGGGIEGSGLSAHIMLAPPFILEEIHLDELVCKLDKTFTEVLDG